ncbi:scopoletin glucosyltransferase-like [Zingiber officinale]|uniref:Glycosyltransferase n=1 Tax=Zingiber officinale TaxID=94328 RepID=A0A8J5FM92_ZINOF|nr:scopoletin glucosyltransferase-like [Zingiber officinale]KAG6492133.1 hypothetical protein ZIOFF_047083 [Zingiber officinale]
MGHHVADADPLPLRIFFIPFFATGHLIPLVDVARLFAARGVDSTILVTPTNAALIRVTVDAAAAGGLPLRTLIYPFPSADSGLPPGIENISDLPPEESYKIDLAAPFTRPAHEQLLRLHRPDAVVSDVHFPWTALVARDLCVPRFIFTAVGLFPVSVVTSVRQHRPHAGVARDDEPVLVPDLPHPVFLTRSELPEFLRRDVPLRRFRDEYMEAETASAGVIVNSFAEMEASYSEYYLRARGLRSWFVGPVSLAISNAGLRGGGDAAASANRTRCLSWLSVQAPRSVVYACFGSWCRFTNEQLREMAQGLEASGRPFLWVVREEDGQEWMPQGFEQRVEGRGLVLPGWAPQVDVLNHEATGAFLTHCGWNSLLEGIAAGMPMVTWPLSTEQFINEKLVVAVLQVGVRASERCRSTVDDEPHVVRAEELARAVGKIMDGGEEAEGIRRRARELGEKAGQAVREDGSSVKGLSDLIAEIRDWQSKKKDVAADVVGSYHQP